MRESTETKGPLWLPLVLVGLVGLFGMVAARPMRVDFGPMLIFGAAVAGIECVLFVARFRSGKSSYPRLDAVYAAIFGVVALLCAAMGVFLL